MSAVEKAVQAFAVVFSPAEAEGAIQLFEERELAKLTLMIEELRSIQKAWTEKVPATPEDAGRLSELIARGQIALKTLELARTERTKHLVLEQRTVNALFARITDPLTELIKKGKRAQVAYTEAEEARVVRERAEQQRKQEEAARKEAEALAAAEAATSEAARKAALAEAEAASREQAQASVETPREAPTGFRTDSGSSFLRKEWTFEIVDAKLIPRQYLVPDEKAIRAAVRSGVRQIPGVNIFEAKDMTTRVGAGGGRGMLG